MDRLTNHSIQETAVHFLWDTGSYYFLFYPRLFDNLNCIFITEQRFSNL